MSMKIGAVPVEDIEGVHVHENARILEIGADSKRNFRSKYPELMSEIFKNYSEMDKFVTLELKNENMPSVVADARFLPFKDSI